MILFNITIQENKSSITKDTILSRVEVDTQVSQVNETSSELHILKEIKKRLNLNEKIQLVNNKERKIDEETINEIFSLLNDVYN